MRSLFLFLCMLLGACSSSRAPVYPPLTPDTIAVLPLQYSDEAGWEKVQRECELQQLLPSYIHEHHPAAIPSSTPGAVGRTLEIVAVQMFAPGGGLYSGPKRLTLQGRLFEGDTLVGSFEARRTTMGGAFAQMKGTCAFMRRNAKALAQDIAGWLASPTMDAKLGEL